MRVTLARLAWRCKALLRPRTVLTLSPRSEGTVEVAMLQVVKNDSTLRHVKELIFEYNQQLLELGCDVGSFQVSLDSHRAHAYAHACMPSA